MNIDALTEEQINEQVSIAEGWVSPTDPLMHEWRKVHAELPGAAKIAVDEPIWLERRDLDARWWRGPCNYTRSWAKAGPLLEQYGITIERIEQADGTYTFRCPHYKHAQRDQTYLLAAMRAYLGLRQKQSA